MNFLIWGMTGTLATEREDQLEFAQARLWHWLDAIDQSCNRFRPDSELTLLNERGEGDLSSTLELALVGALEAYDVTGGLCDPTVLPSLLALGYDVDYAELAPTRQRRRARPLGRVPVCTPSRSISPDTTSPSLVGVSSTSEQARRRSRLT